MNDEDRSLPGEFKLIARYLAPLSSGFPGAFNLTDDAAVIAPFSGHDLIVKADTVVAGVHFREDDPPDLVARKALRVNLSDIASKGGIARAYMLALVLPKSTTAIWMAEFARGLAADQKEYDVHLIGGDTNASGGPLMIAITAFGEVPHDRMLRRSGAGPHDRVFVTGTIGDALLSLRALQGAMSLTSPEAEAALVARYQLPHPRVSAGPRLLDVATATIDISDGLLADHGHICEESGLGAVVQSESLPLSPAARSVATADPDIFAAILCGGDDYEILFTAPPGARPAVERIQQATGIPISEIGYMTPSLGVAGKRIRVLDADRKELPVRVTGWKHF
ncbi:MAG: thiamine-phosphate kinase [Hyphomicrobiales bacterium]|nr:thiamine-phosphate kinase [Hyphomicrobiales bacterium]MCP5001021.1 thiamine-phosphate kinase [Hyphomicrobiales bacterium]